jgi:hypothetical protein
MPVKSKAQQRFMEAVKHGDIQKKGLSKDDAAEFLSHKPAKKLPERVKQKKP